jgi:hypothetical protein
VCVCLAGGGRGEEGGGTPSQHTTPERLTHDTHAHEHTHTHTHMCTHMCTPAGGHTCGPLSTLVRPSAAMPSAALKPSLVQSEMGQPWSRVENGHAPLLMWR